MRSLLNYLNRLWYWSGKNVCRAVFIPLFRIRTFGKENIPSAGPILLLSNHQSFLDPIFFQVPLKRNLYCVARDSLYTGNKLFGLLLSSVYTIPIRRGEADLSAMKKIISKLNHGWGVCLFPEGTRTRDGRIADIKPGFGLLSRRTGAKIIPVVIDGAFECWPRDKKFPSLGRVVVNYGEPMSPEMVKELGDREFANFLTERMRRMQNKCRIKMGREPFDYATIDEA